MKHVLLLGLLSACFLPGCTYEVGMPYLKPTDPQIQQASLANVYMVVSRPDVAGTATNTKSSFLSEADLPVELNVDLLAAHVARLLKERGGRLTAYRAVPGDSEDAFAALLHPTSVLYVFFSKPQTQQKQKTETRTEKVDDKKVEKEVPYWQVEAAVDVEARMLSYPEGTVLRSSKKNLSVEKRYDQEGDSEIHKRFEESMEDLTKKAVKGPVLEALPIVIEIHKRKLYTNRDISGSEFAAEDGSRGRWDKAVPTWKKRLDADPKDWQAAWNLGVWAESQKDIPAARSYYNQAQALSLGIKGAPDSWASVYADLDQILPTAVSAPDVAQSWFSQKVAVLPFTDVSTSLDGPVNVRRLTQAALARNGYAAMPLEEVDAILKEHGFTQGGQLAATTPDQLADWLKADFLLYGDLGKFDEITLGIFGWKRINGTYKLWSTSKKDFLWVSNKSISRTSSASVSKASQLGWAFLQQMLGAWSDRAAHKPMAEESAYYVDEQLSGLPRRPNP